MTMTTEERVNEYYWWVLKGIKEELETTPSNKPIRYELSHVAGAGVPNNEMEGNIVRKLEELKTIRILNEFPREPGYSRHTTFELVVLQPEFDEIYEKYRKACDPQGYLNTYQDKVSENLKNKQNVKLGVPEFLHVEEPKLTIGETTVVEEVAPKQWLVLQAIWTSYEAFSRPDSVMVPIDRISTDRGSFEEFDDIVEGLKKEGCFETWARNDRYYAIEHVSHTRLPEAYLQTKSVKATHLPRSENSSPEETKITSAPSGNELVCGSLRVNLDQGVIYRGNNSPVEISPDNNIVKFLVILIGSNKIVEYVEIAKKLEMNCWHERASNKDVAREVQFLKRDLVTFLRNGLGMTKKEIRGMVVNKKNFGYKLRCG